MKSLKTKLKLDNEIIETESGVPESVRDIGIVDNNSNINLDGTTSGSYGIAIGTGSQTLNTSSIAIGNGGNTLAAANQSIQLGDGSNNKEKSFQVYEYELLDGNTGKIPNERLRDVANLIEENNFTGRNVFNAETQFNGPIESSSDISITNHALKILDSTSSGDALTWTINNPWGSDEMATFGYISINFTSNGKKFIQFCGEGDIGYTLEGQSQHMWISQNWTSNSGYSPLGVSNGDDLSMYRTVTFETAPSGNLLDWLKTHAVPQAGPSKDTVTQYKSDQIIIEQNGDGASRAFNFPERAGTLAVIDDIKDSLFKNSTFESTGNGNLKEDLWKTEDLDTTLLIQHQNGSGQSGYNVSKNYTEMSSTLTTENKITSTKLAITNDTATLTSDDGGTNQKQFKMTPTEMLFSERPKVTTNGTQSEVVIKDDLAGYVPSQSDIETTVSDSSSSNLTWKLNETIDYTSGFASPVKFSSNNESFVAIFTQPDSAGEWAGLAYGNPHNMVWTPSNKWINEVYRTITFETEPTGNVLTWLQANGVTTPLTEKTYAQIINENATITFRIFKDRAINDLQNLHITEGGVTINGKPIQTGSEITVDSTLSDTSENPVQNKVINHALKDKLNILGVNESNRVYVRKDNNLDSSLPFTYSAEASSIAYRNPSGQLQVEDPSQQKDAVNKQYADNLQKYLSLSGESGTLEDNQYALVTGYDNLIIQRASIDFRRSGHPVDNQGNYVFIAPYYSQPNGTEEFVAYVITIKTDKTWTSTIKNFIQTSEQTYAPYVQITPDSATNGNLTDDDFNNLTEHDDVYIILNNEYYRKADNGHTPGILSYTHTGWNGIQTQDKSINITISTKAWTLVVRTPDSTPTKDSTNTITSGGVYSALDKLNQSYEQSEADNATIIRNGNIVKQMVKFTITGNSEKIWSFPYSYDSGKTPMCWVNCVSEGNSVSNGAAVISCSNTSMTVRVCGIDSEVTLFAEGWITKA